MFLVPVIEREFRRALHWNKGTKSRFRVALIGTAIVGLFLCLVALGGAAQWGRNLHQLFFWIGLYLAIAPAMRISVGLFSEERRNQTLELLFLTGMRAADVFAGKLVGGALIASADLLALAPLLALPFLMGGVSLDLYLATLSCLPVLLLFVVAVGVLASVLFKDDGGATIFMGLFAACICLATPVPYYLGNSLIGSTPFSSKWLCLSPAYAPYLVYQSFATVGRSEFWMAEMATLAWSGVCLVLAGLVLSRNWRTEVRGTARSGWQDFFDFCIRGSVAWRSCLRKQLLVKNPFQWLAESDRRPVLLAYGAVGLISVLWILGWHAWPGAWPSNANFFITAMVLMAVVNWLRLYAAASRMGTDRRDGALELLLTAPLSPEEIVDGEVDALTTQFTPLQHAVLVLLILMMVGGFFMRSWNARAVFVYVAIWWVLCAWCLRNPKDRILKVMWAALNTGRPVYALGKWAGNKWTWFWAIYNARILLNSGLGGSAASFPSGSVTEFISACIIGVLAAAFYYLGRAAKRELAGATRRRLVREMRLIATEPVPDPNDPSFEKWDSVERLDYRVASTKAPAGWPAFADPPASDRPPAREGPAPKVIVLPDTLYLLRLLQERKVAFVIVGGLAMSGYLQDRAAKDVDVLMSGASLEALPELEIKQRTGFFCQAQIRGIRVVIYLTEHPLFEAVRSRFATTLNIEGMEVPAVTVEGMVALNLYAVYLISRYRDYYRVERYELNLISLLARYPLSFDPLLTLVREHVPEQNMPELEETLKECAEHAARLRERRNKAKGNSVFR